jgi:peptide/nickel transport system permease protein
MLAFLVRRALQALLVMLVVALIAFTLFRFVGDPINQMVGLDTSAEERAQLRETLGLNDPVPVQFARFVWRALHFDFGISYQFKQPVVDLIGERFPATIELAFVSALLALLLGIPMGVYTALNRRSWVSTLLLTVSLVGISLPVFLIGILLIFIFAVTLGVLPSFGRGDVVRVGFWTTGLLTTSGLRAIVLPAVTLGLFQLTLIMRLVRAEMLEVLRADQSRGQLRSCAQEHAGSRHHHRRPAARFGDRLRHHHRDRVPMARHGAALPHCCAECRHSGDGGLSAAGRRHLRRDQSRR